jgi:hypothetical protein
VNETNSVNDAPGDVGTSKRPEDDKQTTREMLWWTMSSLARERSPPLSLGILGREWLCEPTNTIF